MTVNVGELPFDASSPSVSVRYVDDIGGKIYDHDSRVISLTHELGQPEGGKAKDISGSGVFSLELDNHDFYYFERPFFASGQLAKKMVIEYGYPGRSVSFTGLHQANQIGFQKIMVKLIPQAHTKNDYKHRSEPNDYMAVVLQKMLKNGEFGDYIKKIYIEKAIALAVNKVTSFAGSAWEFLNESLSNVNPRVTYLVKDDSIFIYQVGMRTPTRAYSYHHGYGNLLDLNIVDMNFEVGIVYALAGMPIELRNSSADNVNAKTEKVSPEDGSEVILKRGSSEQDPSVPDPKLCISDVGLIPYALSGEQRALMAKTIANHRNAITIEMTIIGDPYISPKDTIRLDDLPPLIGGLYAVNSVKHHFSGEGYKTTINASKTNLQGTQELYEVNAAQRDGKFFVMQKINDSIERSDANIDGYEILKKASTLRR